VYVIFWMLCIRSFSYSILDVCGGFPRRWPDEDYFGTFDEVGVANKYILKTILDSPYPKNANVRVVVF
jgi:hypothetical protein